MGYLYMIKNIYIIPNMDLYTVLPLFAIIQSPFLTVTFAILTSDLGGIL